MTFFLPKLREYSLDTSNPENNHMLGVAVVAAESGLAVSIHRSAPLEDDVLPDNAPARAKFIHPAVVKRLGELRDEGKVKLSISQLTQEQMKRLLANQFSQGRYGLIILNWDKWNSDAQKKYGNPRHIVACYGLSDNKINIIDPSLPEGDNPVITTS